MVYIVSTELFLHLAESFNKCRHKRIVVFLCYTKDTLLMATCSARLATTCFFCELQGSYEHSYPASAWLVSRAPKIVLLRMYPSRTPLRCIDRVCRATRQLNVRVVCPVQLYHEWSFFNTRMSDDCRTTLMPCSRPVLK